jgi:hypothetical protein
MLRFEYLSVEVDGRTPLHRKLALTPTVVQQP